MLRGFNFSYLNLKLKLLISYAEYLFIENSIDNIILLSLMCSFRLYMLYIETMDYFIAAIIRG